ncbi:hypothetical protein LX32DRAFT_177635 [Colletotrichum zoysiae]|uniref:Uncharacterized protein n=1 Tax=Colletotrichum zoysiae TaxID=1216348 RepID=A0AAD9H652_9PEZI|nr:hypothetical protein LX32DRAFT_177635 [Colletotrichum zoysiae]
MQFGPVRGPGMRPLSTTTNSSPVILASVSSCTMTSIICPPSSDDWMPTAFFCGRWVRWARIQTTAPFFQTCQTSTSSLHAADSINWPHIQQLTALSLLAWPTCRYRNQPGCWPDGDQIQTRIGA